MGGKSEMSNIRSKSDETIRMLKYSYRQMLEIRITLQNVMNLVNFSPNPKIFRELIRERKNIRVISCKLFHSILEFLDSLMETSRELMSPNDLTVSIYTEPSISSCCNNMWSRNYRVYWSRLAFIEDYITIHHDTFITTRPINKRLNENHLDNKSWHKENVEASKNNRPLSKNLLQAMLEMPTKINQFKSTKETCDTPWIDAEKKTSALINCIKDDEKYSDEEFYQGIIRESIKTGRENLQNKRKKSFRKTIALFESPKKNLSKCRQLKYQIEEKLVNFMTPISLSEKINIRSLLNLFGELG